MDTTRAQHFIGTFWDDSILPSITEYIRIPNKSPAFDPKWVEHGYMEDAVKLMEAWARPQLERTYQHWQKHRLDTGSALGRMTPVPPPPP